MDLSKLSTEDLMALKSGDLSKVSTEGLMELKRQQSQPQSIAEQNLAALNGRGPIDDLVAMNHDIGNDVKAGIGGIADLAAGNGLDTATANIKKVQNDQDPTTAAAYAGSHIGSAFTPAQIGMQAALGGIFEALGPSLAGLLKSWGAKMAANAVGKVKNIADMLGIKNLESIGKFLLTPISIGGKEFEPIVQATSSPADMLKAAEAMKSAAVKQLQAVAGQADEAISNAAEDGGVSFAIDLPALKAQIKEMRDEIADSAPNMGKSVVNQYEAALADLEKNIDKVKAGNTDKVFSAFSKLKTIIGDLVYKHGSPLESKAAFNDVYHALNDTLKQAASNAGGTVGADYLQANEVYHQLMAIIDALEGRTTDAAKLFDAPALITAVATGAKTPGMMAIPAALGTYAAARGAEAYGPQMIAAGLNASPVLGPALQAGIRAATPVVSGLVNALTKDNE